MSEEPHLTCETCRYFSVREGKGICRRHPPQVFVFESERGDHLPVTEWPQVLPDDWVWRHRAQISHAGVDFAMTEPMDEFGVDNAQICPLKVKEGVRRQGYSEGLVS